jgi:DNA repair protein RadA/Sms
MTKKNKVIYICKVCGYKSPTWLGKCPSCQSWNSFEIQNELKEEKNLNKSVNIEALKTFSNVDSIKFQKIKTNIEEFDRVLGGGIVKGSLILIAGEPGIGKSTLLLQMCNALAPVGKVLYVSGEESPEQIKLRAQRLNILNENILILTETDLEEILNYIEFLKPTAVVIDSIQTINNSELYGITASISQIRDNAVSLLKIAKKTGIPIFIIGHITKEGGIAGPKSLEHIVDVVLYMEGDNFHSFRILKSYKNRFGSTYEIGMFEMTEKGFIEVKNPSLYFLNETETENPGSAVGIIIEGTRPILIEIQSLVVPTSMPYPRRVSEGVDYNKLLLIIAVLEKHLNLKLSSYEIYIKVAGGMKVKEPAIDLAVASAIISSYQNKTLNNSKVFIGEIGLTGEIRAVPYINLRVQEALKCGFKEIILSYNNLNKIEKNLKEKIKTIKNISEIFNFL